MEGYLELVVETLEGAGYRWYETANFCRRATGEGGRGRRAREDGIGGRATTSRTGRGATTSGSGSGPSRPSRPAVAKPPTARAYVAALAAGTPPRRELEPLDAATRAAPGAAHARASARRAAAARRGGTTRSTRPRRSSGWNASGSPSAARDALRAGTRPVGRQPRVARLTVELLDGNACKSRLSCHGRLNVAMRSAYYPVGTERRLGRASTIGS